LPMPIKGAEMPEVVVGVQFHSDGKHVHAISIKHGERGSTWMPVGRVVGDKLKAMGITDFGPSVETQPKWFLGFQPERKTPEPRLPIGIKTIPYKTVMEMVEQRIAELGRDEDKMEVEGIPGWLLRRAEEEVGKARKKKLMEIVEKVKREKGEVVEGITYVPLDDLADEAKRQGYEDWDDWVELVNMLQSQPNVKVEPLSVKFPEPEALPAIGDYVLWGSRLLIYRGPTGQVTLGGKQENILLEDPFWKQGDAWDRNFTLTMEESKKLERPTKQYVISEYKRLKIKPPADFKQKLAKLSEGEAEEEEMAEGAEELPPMKRPEWREPLESQIAQARLEKARVSSSEEKRERREFPVKVEVSGAGGKYFVEWSIPSTDFYRSASELTMGEVEEYLASGKETIDVRYEIQQIGDPHIILDSLNNWGFYSAPELAEFYKKVREERYDEITEAEEEKAEEVWEKVKKIDFVLTWKPGDVKWAPETVGEKEIYHRKHTFDELMALPLAKVTHIAMVKNISLKDAKRKDEIARLVHQHDFGEEQAKAKLAEIEKLLG